MCDSDDVGWRPLVGEEEEEDTEPRRLLAGRGGGGVGGHVEAVGGEGVGWDGRRGGGRRGEEEEPAGGGEARWMGGGGGQWKPLLVPTREGEAVCERADRWTVLVGPDFLVRAGKTRVGEKRLEISDDPCVIRINNCVTLALRAHKSVKNTVFRIVGPCDRKIVCGCVRRVRP